LAQIYADGEGADWDTNPTPVSITEIEVDQNTVLDIKLAAGGGQAIRFVAQ
jgi:alpha-glucosidase